MPGLFTSLFTASNALQAQSAQLDIIGRNLANVNNPAYARQRVVLGDKGSVNTPLGAQSLGTQAVGIQQMRDQLLDGQIRDENSIAASFDSQDKYLQQAQTALGQGLFGQSGAIDSIGANAQTPSGLAAMIDAFFNSWQTYSNDPTNVVNKQQLIASTDDLLNSVHTADKRLADLALPAAGNTLTGQMDADVGQVNSLLQNLADLNKQIGTVEIGNPGSAVDLRDQREAKLEDLAKLIDFTAVPQANGEVGVQVRDAANNPINILDLGVVTGTLARNGTNYQWTPTAGPAATLAVGGGSLRGYQQVGTTIQGYRDQLDTFVQNLVTQVNTAYNSPVNGDFFNGANLTAATVSRTATLANLRAVDVGGATGGNDRALAVAALAHDPTFLNGTPAQAFARVVTGTAQDVATNTTRLEDQKALGDFLQTQRNSYGGVSIDEEVTNMMQTQRAYQASAKIMSVIDQLLSEVMNTLSQ